MIDKRLTEEDYKWLDENQSELRDLATKHAQDTRKTQTDEYLLEAFPEAKEIVPQKLQEYWKEATEIYAKLKEIRKIVDRSQADTFSKWFYFNKEKYTEGKRLDFLRNQINRLTRLKMVYEKKEIEKHLSKEYFKTIKERERYDIDRMFNRKNLLTDILVFNGITLTAKGGMFGGLCPFHTEKTPSFFSYPGNWYHCFGCGAHGNFIDFLMKHKTLSFREALEEANRFV